MLGSGRRTGQSLLTRGDITVASGRNTGCELPDSPVFLTVGTEVVMEIS